MTDPQPPLFRVILWECDRCQFQQKKLVEGHPPWTAYDLPVGWRRQSGYLLCGGCDLNALEPEFQEVINSERE